MSISVDLLAVPQPLAAFLPDKGYQLGFGARRKVIAFGKIRGSVVTAETLVSVDENVLFNELEGEAVLLNLRTGIYYGLNPLGTRILTLIRDHAKLSAVHSLLLQEYDVAPEKLWDDLVRLLDEMHSAGLLKMHNPEDLDNSSAR